MKILDRYVLSMFVKNYLISFLVLIGMYITLDMVFNFDDFVAPTPPGQVQPAGVVSLLTLGYDIADYYFYQSFFFFVQLSGIIPVVAAAFTLMRLSRFNELTAVLAAGTPLLRVATPIIIAGLVLNVLLIVDQELIVPQIIPKLVRSHEDMHRTDVKTFPVQSMLDDKGSLMMCARYSPAAGGDPPSMMEVDIVERSDPAEPMQPTAHVYAESASWDDIRQQWDLTNGRRVRVLGPREVGSVKEIPCDVYKSNITPDEISLYRGGEYVQFLSTARINKMLDPAHRASFGMSNLLRVKHMRFTQPLSNVILLLLAIPAVLTRDPGALKLAAMKCLVLSALCMGSVFLCFQLAGSPPTHDPQWVDSWPALMAWMPVFIFGPLSVWLLDRVKT